MVNTFVMGDGSIRDVVPSQEKLLIRNLEILDHSIITRGPREILTGTQRSTYCL